MRLRPLMVLFCLSLTTPLAAFNSPLADGVIVETLSRINQFKLKGGQWQACQTTNTQDLSIRSCDVSEALIAIESVEVDQTLYPTRGVFIYDRKTGRNKYVFKGVIKTELATQVIDIPYSFSLVHEDGSYKAVGYFRADELNMSHQILGQLKAPY